MSAIEATSVRVSTLVDGTLRLTVDIEPRHAISAFTLFGAPGTALALAALRAKPEPKAPPKPVLHSQWLAMRCEDADFQKWIGVANAAQAAEKVRTWLEVKSRAEIDTDHEAFERFERLIRKPWAEYNRKTA